MPTQKLIRCEPGDPNQCQGSGKGGQCEYLSIKGMVEGGHFAEGEFDESLVAEVTNCPRHGGWKQIESAQAKRVHAYRLQQWQERLDEFAEDEEVKSLRGEIGIARLVLEQILNRCQDHQQLLLYSQKIGQLVGQIERLVRACERIERSSSMMLDRSSALSFASKVVEVISRHVDDAEVIDRISAEIIDALADE